MSVLKSRVGPWTMTWKSIPRGNEGFAQVEVQDGKLIDVRWRQDRDGIWILLPQGVYGFDLRREWDENAQVLYHVSQRGNSAEWINLPFFRGNEEAQLSTKGNKAKATRIRAQMPGKMIRVMVAVGQRVEKDQPVLIMEAMKMENEIRASQSGSVKQVHVKEGQAVESGADLLLIEPDVG